MARILYLIRHGATAGSEVKRYKGTIDVPLSDEGRGQMKKTAQFVKGMISSSQSVIKAVYSSNLSRASESAEILAAPLGLKPIITPELRERNFGRWEGMSFDEITKKYPKEFGEWRKNPLRFRPVGGESTIELRDRAVAALKGILRIHGEESIAIVAHGGINRAILCHLLGIPLKNIFRVEQDFACVNIIEFHDGYPVVRLLNYSAHLRKTKRIKGDER